jgi:uncharacterized protein YigE (DUF2233 family)
MRFCQSALGDTFDLFVVRARRDNVSVRVIYPYRALKSRAQASIVDYSLSELNDALTPLAVINGGPTASFARPIPAGLLIANGLLVSRLNPASSRMTGVFWVRGGTVGISSAKAFQTGGLTGAVQAGPIIVSRGQRVVSTAEQLKPKYARSIVAIDRQGRLLLVTTTSAWLYNVASRLVQSEQAGGLDCVAALNLDGADSSGILVRERSGLVTRGTTNSLIASAIGLSPRPRR